MQRWTNLEIPTGFDAFETLSTNMHSLYAANVFIPQTSKRKSPFLLKNLNKRYINPNRSFRCSNKRQIWINSMGSSPPSGQGSEEEIRLLSKLNKSIQTRDLLQQHQKVLVATSGGQDSISLLFLLNKLQHKWFWKIGVVHCDHQWSGSSRLQAAHVAQIASYLGFDYYQAVATRDVSGETSARAWRYQALHRIARSHGYSAIVTAHTSSDRIETLLLNLFRGTGLHGLLSLTWKRPIFNERELGFDPFVPTHMKSSRHISNKEMIRFEHPFEEHNRDSRPIVNEEEIRFKTLIQECNIVTLIRPLLEFTRVELREYCDHEKLPIWPDPSNFSLEIKRNKIRHQLLPFLRKSFQPGIDRSLARWAEILQGEDAFLEDLCESIRKQSEYSGNNGVIKTRKLDISSIRGLHIAIQRRVIKQFVESFSNKSLGFDHVEHLRVTCIAQPCRNGLHFSLPGNVDLEYVDNSFVLCMKQ